MWGGGRRGCWMGGFVGVVVVGGGGGGLLCWRWA